MLEYEEIVPFKSAMAPCDDVKPLWSKLSSNFTFTLPFLPTRLCWTKAEGFLSVAYGGVSAEAQSCGFLSQLVSRLVQAPRLLFVCEFLCGDIHIRSHDSIHVFAYLWVSVSPWETLYAYAFTDATLSDGESVKDLHLQQLSPVFCETGGGGGGVGTLLSKEDTTASEDYCIWSGSDNEFVLTEKECSWK